MQYNLTHRGAVIATFDTATMDPIEVREMKRLSGLYFRIERTAPDQLPPMPEDFDNLAGINGWDYAKNPEQYIPSRRRY